MIASYWGCQPKAGGLVREASTGLGTEGSSARAETLTLGTLLSITSSCFIDQGMMTLLISPEQRGLSLGCQIYFAPDQQPFLSCLCSPEQQDACLAAFSPLACNSLQMNVRSRGG